MARKPAADLRLILLEPRQTPEPPADLGPAGREIWQSIASEFEVADAEGLLVLKLAAQAADRAASCKDVIDRDGVTIRTPTGIRSHPLIRDETQCRALCARLIGKLGLRLEPVKAIGRPGGGKGG